MKKDILELFEQSPHTPATPGELLARLGLPKKKRSHLLEVLRALESRGLVVRLGGDRYLSREASSLFSGRIQITRGGRGFLAPEDSDIPEIAIPASATGTALHDDRVLVHAHRGPEKRGLRTLFRRRGGENSTPSGPKKPEGAVVRVEERARTRFVGVLQQEGKRTLVAPDDPRFPRAIEISRTDGGVDAPRAPKAGHKAVVELIDWKSPRSAPAGRIVEVLGPPDRVGVDMLGVLRHYELDSDFPEKVLAEARQLGTTVTAADREGRRDCRAHETVTIDPDDARDFDDAFSLERAGEKRWTLRIHIADVSHYVRPGTALDREARRRGNSSYLVDRVVPMLPEELSNELCSLKPEVDRLTKCVEFLLSDDGRVLRTEFYPAVIHSRRRFTYAEAMAVLERPRPADEIEKMLQHAGELAQSIRRRRFENGSLDLEFPETRIRLDDRGRVEGIDLEETDLSHQLVEEFMLLANEAVAARLAKRGKPALYRVHEAPDPDRVGEYREEVRGHDVTCGNLTRRGEVNKLFARLGEFAAGAALKIGFLKCLPRARYTDDPLGHYGLAKKNYTHFTSPIRRYADLLVHRSLFPHPEHGEATELGEVADHLSATERNSSDAERDSKDVKVHAFLRHQIRSGKRIAYSARITGLKEFGFFVDVPGLGSSGAVPLSRIQDDHYQLDENAREIRGRKSGRVFRLGDEIQVEVADVDEERKRVDFRLAGASSDPDRPRRRGRGRSSRGNRKPGGENGKPEQGGKNGKTRARKGDEQSAPKGAKDGKASGSAPDRSQDASEGARNASTAKRGGRRRSRRRNRGRAGGS